MCVFSPITNELPMTSPKTHKQTFSTRPIPGKSSEFVSIYVFFPKLLIKGLGCAREVQNGVENQSKSTISGEIQKGMGRRGGTENVIICCVKCRMTLYDIL